MSDASQERLERLEMLLAEEALGQLDTDQQAELLELLKIFPDVDRNSFHRAAAAMDLAFAEHSRDEFPEHLRLKILDQAKAFVSSEPAAKPSVGPSRNGSHGIGENGKSSSSNGRAAVAAVRENAGRASLTGSPAAGLYGESNSSKHTAGSEDSATTVSLPTRTERGTVDPWRWAGWLVASAAILTLVIFQFVSPRSDQRVADNGPQDIDGASIVSAEPVSLNQQREELLQQPETRVYPWTAGPTPMDSEIQGNVVWNQKLQAGFMTFEGLPVNDATLTQYQLWIIDPSRDKHPIDGGVFDINDQGQVIVKINPKLEVLDPQAFAITIEQPGGVVVSDQSRLPLLAAVN